MAEGGRSVGFYIGIGCLLIVGVLAVAAGACGVWVYSEAQRFERELEDPESRRTRVLEVLGADELPAGYEPGVAFSVPFLLETAILSDRPMRDGEGNQFDERGFIYTKLIRLGGADEQELRNYFEGASDDAGALRGSGINIDADEILGRGVVNVKDMEILYVAQRGSFGARESRGEGLASVSLVECPNDERYRVAIWFGPDVEQAEGATSSSGEAAAAAGSEMATALDLSGTAADPEEIRAFFGHFDLCR